MAIAETHQQHWSRSCQLTINMGKHLLLLQTSNLNLLS